ncbi:MAG: 50S ribosomal protein L18e [Thermoplasmata archaeon]
MPRNVYKQNPELTHALVELRRAARAHSAPIWTAVARRLARPRHQVNPVNVGRLDRVGSPAAPVVIPGKLLAQGALSQALTVAVFDCSDAARAKVHAAGGKVLTIHELIKSHPNGTGVRIIG